MRGGLKISLQNEMLKIVLTDMHELIRKGCYTLAKRDINASFMKEYLLSDQDLQEIILNLTPEDYRKGPEKDKDGYEGSVYVFKSLYLDEFFIPRTIMVSVSSFEML